MQRTTYGHAMLLLTSLARDYLQVEVLVLVDRMAAEDSV